MVLLAYSTLSNAQSLEVSLNLQSGISYASIDNIVYENASVSSALAFRGGIEGTYFFNDIWGARIGGSLLTTHYHEVDEAYSLSEDGVEVPAITSAKIPTYYLSMPTQAVYKIPLKNIDIKLAAGMQYHFYLGSKDNALQKVQQYPWYKKSYLSGNFGLAFSKSLNDKFSLSLGFTTEMPFTNFLEANDGIAQLNSQSRLWQVFIPLKFTCLFKKN
ncbi:MAG: hypothetical protein Sapg2KO_17810 [Saprospiraceae bacterium]